MEKTTISNLIDATYNLMYKIQGDGFQALAETIEKHQENLLFIENYISYTEKKDLFEDWEKLPTLLREVLESNYKDGPNQEELDGIQKEIQKLGYTFDNDFSCNAYGLRPICVAIEELDGYDD